MKKHKLIDAEIDEFYSTTSEEHRLSMGLGPLELSRNKELISGYLPAGKGVIVDVGGGPGIYSEWLAELGHKVHLVDPVEKHIQQATKRAAKLKNPFVPVWGEARKLEFANDAADLVILHGPLYHLQTKNERLDAIKEAKRITKKGGIILGFAINYTAYTLTGLLNGMIHDTKFFKMCMDHLTTGTHTYTGNPTGLFPKAYCHKPSELKKEMEESGLTCLELLPVEGMIWITEKYFESMFDPTKKNRLMELLKNTEKDENLLAFSPHMMIAVKK